MDAQNQVILVDYSDEVVGYMEKIEAHKRGLLHRAISVFILNSKNEWLLQQRAADKYHSGLLWSNASCTHPYINECNLTAANRRLKEEIGLETELTKLFDFHYRAELDNDLVENELDHVYLGYSDDLPQIDHNEVASFKYIGVEKLAWDIENSPERYTEWFKLLFSKVLNSLDS